MKILKNASLCFLLFSVYAMLLPQFANAQSDEFDIVIKGTDSGRTRGDNPCSTSVQVVKYLIAPIPESVIVSAVASSLTHTTSQKVKVDISNLSNNSATSIANAEFPDLLSGHRAKCTVNYLMEVHTKDGVITKTLNTPEIVPIPCYKRY